MKYFNHFYVVKGEIFLPGDVVCCDVVDNIEFRQYMNTIHRTKK